MRKREFGSIDRMATRTGKPGRWRARYTDSDGTAHQARFDTQREAGEWLAGQRTDRQRGEWTDPRAGRLTFADWERQWRATVVDLRPSTLARDLGYIDRYMLPTFGPRQLGDIDHLACRAWVAELTARGLAPATVRKAGQILGKIAAEAVAARLVPSSPMANVKLPKVDLAEMRYLTPTEIADLADVIDQRYRALVVVGCYCGLRMGELLALEWSDVDLLHRAVKVDRIVTDVSGNLHYGPPKTRAGRRSVPTPRLVVDALDAHPRTGERVFQAPEGGCVRLNNWRARIWRPATLAAGLEGVRPHDMRHTAVSLWLASEADVKQVATWAGHASVATVLDRYGHLLPGREDAVMARLDALGAETHVSVNANVVRLGNS